MMPFQHLATFESPLRTPTPEWLQVAPILRAWAATAGGSPQEQAEAICTHLIRVWCRPALALAPEQAGYAAALRDAPCAADWDETARIAEAAKDAADVILGGGVTDGGRGLRNIAMNVVSPAREIAWFAAWNATHAALCAGDVRNWRGASNPWPQVTEEWILLARPAIPPLFAPCLDPNANPDPGLYAVAWDALGGDLPTDGTDDGVIVCHNRDRRGFSVPPWAQRTALARCLVRLELSR